MNSERLHKKREKQLQVLEKAIQSGDLRTLKTLTHLPQFSEEVNLRFSTWLDGKCFALCEFAFPYITNIDMALVSALSLDFDTPNHPIVNQIIHKYVTTTPHDQHCVDARWVAISFDNTYLFGGKSTLETIKARFVHLCEEEQNRQQAARIEKQLPVHSNASQRKM